MSNKLLTYLDSNYARRNFLSYSLFSVELLPIYYFYNQENWNLLGQLFGDQQILDETSCSEDKNSTHNVNRIQLAFFKNAQVFYFSGQKSKRAFPTVEQVYDHRSLY